MIYVDYCSKKIEQDIKNSLGLKVVYRMDQNKWSVNEAMCIITDPSLKLIVLSSIDDISIMEISLSNFMCKPVLVTTRAIEEYPALMRTIDHTDYSCDLRSLSNSFIHWYEFIFKGKK